MKYKTEYQKSKVQKTTRGRISRQMIEEYKKDLEFKEKIRNRKLNK